MDWKNKVLNPKGWLMAFGIIFILLGTGNYLTAETAAESAYPDPTDRDVFYEPVSYTHLTLPTKRIV